MLKVFVLFTTVYGIKCFEEIYKQVLQKLTFTISVWTPDADWRTYKEQWLMNQKNSNC